VNDSNNLLEDLILLAADPRFVRTVEGAEFYGLPVGSIITPDVEETKQKSAAKLGITPPKNAISGAPSASTAKAVEASIKTSKSALTGNKKFSVGNSKYSAPAGSKLIKSKNKETAAFLYVLTPEGEVHAFTAGGEVSIPTGLKNVLKVKFSGNLEKDEKYEEIDFEATASPYSMPSLPVGSTLTDPDGEPQFTKVSEKSWRHVQLNVEVDEKDLQGFYDSGELIPEKTPEDEALQSTFGEVAETSFSEMDLPAATAALEAMAVGTTVHLPGPSGANTTKLESGAWGTEGIEAQIESPQLALLKGLLVMGPAPVEEDSNGGLPSDEAPAPTPDAEPPVEAPKDKEVTETPDKTEEAPKVASKESLNLPEGAELVSSLDEVEPDGFFVQALNNPTSEKSFLTFKKKDTEEAVDVEPDMGWEWPTETFAEALESGRVYSIPSPTEVEEAKPQSTEEPDDAMKGFTLSDLEGYRPGTVIDYKYKLGYSSVPSDPLNWEKLAGGVWTHSKFGSDVDSTALESIISNYQGEIVYSVKAPEKAPEGVITSYEQMDELENGTILNFAKKDGKLSQYTKLDTGKWLTPGGQTLLSSDLKNSAASGKFSVASKDSGNPDPLETTFETGGESFSPDEMQEALNALEGHPSFQIAYGLKSVPENPLAKLPKDQLKVWAKTAHPDLPPKQGVVQMLKDKLGIKTETKKEKNSEGPTVNIGSAESQTTPTGETGGAFTKDDIEQAIEILEGFNGKIFKSELNKKGNALGKLSPNDIVGFDKDKTVTKQKFIDLLKSKLTKFPQAEEEKTSKNVGDGLTEAADIINAPEGTVVPAEAGGHFLKTQTDQWNYLDDDGVLTGLFSDDDVWESTVYGSIPELKTELLEEDSQDPIGDILKKLPNSDDGLDYSDNADATPADVENAKKGDIFEDTFGGFHTKTTDTQWEFFNADEEGISIGIGGTQKNAASLGQLKKLDEIDTEKNKSGLHPGKYTGGGPTYMVVKEDGTGVYVNSTGAATSLTTAKVKANHKAGMNKYLGIPSDYPEPAEKKTSSTNKSVLKPKLKNVEALEDGTYFNGSPSGAKAWTYEVNGDVVTVTKPKSATVGSTGKIGQKTTALWLFEASTGAQIVGNYDDMDSHTKQADGSWKKSNGDPTPEEVLKSASSYYPYYKIKSHGDAEPVQLTKAKIQTLFVQGKLTDEFGNSVLPQGYTGDVTFFGKEVSTYSLLEAQKLFKEYETSENKGTLAEQNKVVNAVKEAGAVYEAALVLKYAVEQPSTPFDDDKSTSQSNDDKLKVVADAVDAMLAGVNTEIPDSNTTKLFTWDIQGSAVMPEELMDSVNVTTNAEKKAWIKKASMSIGNGEIIGLHSTKMDIYDKQQWISAFNKGDFVQVYNIEVKAAAAEGKAHKSGYKHPGYQENEGTHKVHWAAAVPGEVSALRPVKGDWTPMGTTQIPIAELDNYLIKAQMKYPEHLTVADRRAWVFAHRNNQKALVDKLSLSAQKRSKDGNKTLSDPVEWTDDIVPAKAYDQLFDNSQFPTEGWTTSLSEKYYDDVAESNPELTAIYEEALAASTFGNPSIVKNKAVTDYFQKKSHEQYLESLIPVYTKKPLQTVKQGTHPIAEYSDQHGNDYFFKPRPDTDNGRFRAEVEGLGNSLGRLWGFNSAEPRLVTIDGQYGLLQSKVHGVGDLMGADYGTLSVDQIAGVGGEHVLDWLLDNDDTKGDNAIIDGSGKIVGIDKGRAFRSYGSWKGLSGDHKADSNAKTVYTQLFDSMRAGKIDKATADAAYLKIQRRITNVSKIDDASIRDLMVEGMKSRDTGYDVPYKIDGTLVSQDFEGLMAAVLDRRDHLSVDFETLWAGAYKDSKLGVLPEIPDTPLGDVLSGLGDSRLHEQVLTTGSVGKSTMVGGADIQGGFATVWTDEYESGSKNLLGELTLGPKKQKAVLEFLQTATAQFDKDKSASQGFSAVDVHHSSLLDAAKTVNHHALDKDYNAAKMTKFAETAKTIREDFEEWSPNLISNISVVGVDHYKFKSGTTVPMVHVDQYKMLLDFYQPRLADIEKAHEENGKVAPKIEKFTPLNLSDDLKVYTNPDGVQTATLMANGSYLLKNLDTAQVSFVNSSELDTSEWTPVTVEQPKSLGYVVKLNHHTNEMSGSVEENIKTSNPESTGGVEGSSGVEYEIKLDTGERVFFRNSGQTNTVASQRGKVMFRADGSGKDTAAVANSLERIEGILQTMGIDSTPMDEAGAELVYWREMYQILDNRMHEVGSPYAAAKADLQDFKTQKSDVSETFLETLSDSMTSQEELTFWRDLHTKHFGEEKVSRVLKEELYLPQYDHQMMSQPEMETGKPHWIRYDFTPEEIRETGKMLMTSSTNDPLRQSLVGGSLGAEERLRQNGYWVNGMSATTDQTNDSASNVYTRIHSISEHNSFNAFFDPAALLRTRTYSYSYDRYGDVQWKSSDAPSNPKYALEKFTGSANETMLPHSAALLDIVEVYAFKDSAKRNHAIQALKKRGIEMIRGLPIEERLVMKANVLEALNKVKKQWLK